MASKLIAAIVNKLFVADGKGFVVAKNHDGMLLSDGIKGALETEYGIKVFGGDGLDLRIVRERRAAGAAGSRVLFVATDEIEILEDILQDCDVVNFQMRSLFKRHSWEKVKQLPFERLCRLYERPGYGLLEEPNEEDSPEVRLKAIKVSWDLNLEKLDFNKPTEWMNRASELVLQVIELGKWEDFQNEVKVLNERFNEFLKGSYQNIVSSTCGTKYPRIVTQVLPFINKQKDEKSALIVVDGMNYWQARLLTKSLEKRLGVKAKYDCIYSWLPSVTELSRQAIFRGDAPTVEYVQSPQNEERLWKAFWDARRVAPFEQYYKHSGEISVEGSVKRLAYVVVDLDEMMHDSKDYMYLYDLTHRWVTDKVLLKNVKLLLDGGFKVYITTDHGNIETTGFKKLDGRDRLGADLSNRHITIPNEADKNVFEAQYKGHLCQVDESSRTYYAVDKEAFCSTPRCVTHGGTHWLEVLIPFITLG